MHALDLPNLGTRPSAKILLDTLDLFKPQVVTNFDDSDGGTDIVTHEGLFDWLTRIVGSELGWIDDHDKREQIWDVAGKRMAERCGRSAAPTRTRQMEIEGVDTIQLVEPALTEDNLGFKTWGSALVLAKRLIREPELLQGRVLELGSGTGLVAIVAGNLQQQQRANAWFTATDLPAIVPNLETNISLNNVQVRSAVLDWADPEPFDESGFDTMIVSDPVYSHDHPAMVCRTIDHLLARTGQLILQLPLRAKFDDTRQDLYNRLAALGLKRQRFETEAGRDEFGEMQFAWSLWRF